MLSRFLTDQEGRTPTEYTVLVFFACCAAMMVSFVSGEVVTDLTLEIHKVSELVNQTDQGIHTLAPTSVDKSTQYALD
jgi:Flp pilus assembly pilin Flp